MPIVKTNAMRLLDAQKIEYHVTVYDDAGEFHNAQEAAALIGAPVQEVYKTLVVLSEDAPKSGARKKPLLVMLASHREVDLRGLAKQVGEKKLRMATKKEAEQLTGAPIGAISALAQLNKGFVMLLDHAAMRLEKIHVSGGVRGVDLQLRVTDLIRLTNARVVPVTGDAAELG